jgi:hypothetical protein
VVSTNVRLLDVVDTVAPEVVDTDGPEVVDCVVPGVPEVVDSVVSVGASLDVVAAAMATIDRNVRILDIDFIVKMC